MPYLACVLPGICLCVLISACGSGSSPPAAGESPPPQPPPAPTVGLDARPENLGCVAPPMSEVGGMDVELEPVFSGLSFNQPLAMLQAPTDDTRWFVLEKGGRVRVFANDPEVNGLENDFIALDVNAASEGGLLGMAFHPEFQSNGQVFLSWTEGDPMVSVVARFTSLDGGVTLDPGSRDDIIRVNQDRTNHNGGQIGFGPDGYLYIGLGDGGGAGDPLDRAQDTTNLLGAVLRLDIDGRTPYAIPGDNPFADNAACPADHSGTQDCPEIFAWGLRNPWRWSFDRETQKLWMADVGQNAREEINHVELGGNYGWNCREGSIPFPSPGPSCAGRIGLIGPVYDYTHDQGRSVTGGYVYRGTALPALVGQYIFGDFVSGRVWRLIEGTDGAYAAEELADTGFAIASFAEGNDGELYVVNLGGSLYRIVPREASSEASDDGPPVPALLSETGCVGADPTQPANGLIPFAVNAPAWFDGAARERWLALPQGTTMAIDAGNRFVLPSGSVLMEQFRLQGALIETRLLMHHPNGPWAGYSYAWNAAQTDAVLIEGGKTVAIAGQDWNYPSAGECRACHADVAGHVLGLETAQLNREFFYVATGRSANQLETLDAIGLFEAPLGDPEALPVMVDPADAGAALDARARAYLHANCAHCHREGGGAPGAMDLRFTTLLEHTGTCGVVPQQGDLGIDDARILAAGDPQRSVLLARMLRRDAQAMPPIVSTVVDADGTALIADWIAALSGCQ